MPVEEYRKPIHRGLDGSDRTPGIGVNSDFAWSKICPAADILAGHTPYLLLLDGFSIKRE
ncbi:hypothetical protein EQU24_03455 [Methylotuvimicrobium buryatense]|uniref:Uncharacterized protein n=1 Tax=Methylotuvimicrobium buryatense TaxID=95641 RepID=A0A4P9UJY7_METBY|nr:hypothetical protein EQU24_03455 [Methylotuvimicrobium buryatense]